MLIASPLAYGPSKPRSECQEDAGHLRAAGAAGPDAAFSIGSMDSPPEIIPGAMPSGYTAFDDGHREEHQGTDENECCKEKGSARRRTLDSVSIEFAEATRRSRCTGARCSTSDA